MRPGPYQRRLYWRRISPNSFWIIFFASGLGDNHPRLNAAIAKELAALPPPEQAASLLAASETGPLWFRGLALQEEEELAPILPTILEQMKARAIVIGHSTVLPGRIVARLDGRVILIDTGMVGGEFYKGGVPSALEWTGGTLTAIYLDRREPLSAPALQTTAAAATR